MGKRSQRSEKPAPKRKSLAAVKEQTKPATKKKSAPPPKPSNKKDPNLPKKPATAFFVFLEDFRKTYKRDHPNVKGVAVIGKAGGDKWKGMSAEEKAPFLTKAAKRKADYDRDLEEYNNKKNKKSSKKDEEEEEDEHSPDESEEKVKAEDDEEDAADEEESDDEDE